MEQLDCLDTQYIQMLFEHCLDCGADVYPCTLFVLVGLVNYMVLVIELSEQLGQLVGVLTYDIRRSVAEGKSECLSAHSYAEKHRTL